MLRCTSYLFISKPFKLNQTCNRLIKKKIKRQKGNIITLSFICCFCSNFYYDIKKLTTWLYAAELSFFLSLCFFLGTSLYLHLFNVSFVHEISRGWTWNCLDGHERITSISGIDGVFFCFAVVCWRSHRLSFVPNRFKPGLFLLLC